MARTPAAPRRRQHGEFSAATPEYLASKNGGSASISEIKAALAPKLGIAPDSPYRRALQDERHFERVPAACSSSARAPR